MVYGLVLTTQKHTKKSLFQDIPKISSSIGQQLYHPNDHGHELSLLLVLRHLVSHDQIGMADEEPRANTGGELCRCCVTWRERLSMTNVTQNGE